MSTEEIVYAEAVRAIQHQATSADEIRTRAGVVLGATLLTTSFLGAHALAGHDSLGVWGWAATATSALSVLCALVVLYPWWGWIFVNDPVQVLDDHVKHPATPDQAYVTLTRYLGRHMKKNAELLEGLYLALSFSIVLLIVAVGEWLLELGGR
jgi:hypothetical protein